MENKKTVKLSEGRKKIKGLSVVCPLTLLLVLILLTTYISYAWMRREWTPYIEEEGIRIATSGSLAFQLENYMATGKGMRIFDILGVDQDFVLKPVSNRHGTSQGFFTLSQLGVKGQEKYKYLNVADYNNDFTKMGVENGYIEFKMLLYAPDALTSDRYIYLHSASHIRVHSKTPTEKSRVAECIRVSITLNDNQTYIILPDIAERADGTPLEHMGVNDHIGDEATKYTMDGVNYYMDNSITDPRQEHMGLPIVVAPDVNVTSTKVGKISDFAGGTDFDDSGVPLSPNENNTLFLLKAPTDSETTDKDRDGHWITVRIWAEGTDPACDDAISGAQVDLLLKFAAVPVTADTETTQP